MKDMGTDILEAFDSLSLKDQALLWQDISKRLEFNLKANGFVDNEEVERV